MRLFKFKSLASAECTEHAFDILQNQRLFCSSYRSLNDPFEGQFRWITRMNDDELRLPLKIRPKPLMRRLGCMDDLNHPKKALRVCSLTSDPTDVRMWSHYANSHRGIAIEIDFLRYKVDAVEVEYLPTLKEWSRTLLGEPSPRDVLRYKTKHWEYEAEYRVIQTENYYPIPGRIIAVHVGIAGDPQLKETLRRKLPDQVHVFSTRLDHDGATVAGKFGHNLRRRT
jgi:hypothetical protein